jgi:hypothetical protein
MRRAAVSALLCSASFFGCGRECVEDLPASCTPLYDPTFDNVFNNTLRPTCAAPGASCHSAAGERGGLVFEDPDRSYELLVGEERALAGDAACSEMVVRIESDDPDVVMPPGAPLAAAERCAIAQWIAAGAPR